MFCKTTSKTGGKKQMPLCSPCPLWLKSFYFLQIDFRVNCDCGMPRLTDFAYSRGFLFSRRDHDRVYYVDLPRRHDLLK